MLRWMAATIAALLTLTIACGQLPAASPPGSEAAREGAASASDASR